MKAEKAEGVHGMEALLDFSQPVNVQLLDSVVQKLYTGNPDEVGNRRF